MAKHTVTTFARAIRISDMKLTHEEKQAIEQGKPVEFADGKLRCVVLRADLYRRFSGLLGSELPGTVVTELVDAAMTDYDADDPLLASYQNSES